MRHCGSLLILAALALPARAADDPKADATVYRFVNATGGKFKDAECFWSLDAGKTWHSFADRPTVPCPTGNGRVYVRLGAAPKNFDDRTAYWDSIEYAYAKGEWHGN